MNRLRLALIVLSVVAFGAACESGPKAPKIRSFTATPSLVPTAGGQSTLVWDVRGADSITIEPGIGLVQGSSLTVNVTGTTEFELIAENDGRSRRRTTTVTCAPPGAILGHVRTMLLREPIPGVGVFINGEALLTDESGNFSVVDVPTPYDVIVFDPTQRFAMIWKGLTRLDPILELPFDDTFAPVTTFALTVSGNFGPGTADPDTDTQVFLKAGLQPAPPFYFTNAAGDYSGNMPWPAYDDDVVDAAAIAVRYVTNPMSGAVNFTHLTSIAFSADPNGPAITGIGGTLDPVANAVATGTYGLDADQVLGSQIPTLLMGTPTGAFSDLGFQLPPGALVNGTNDDFSLSAPDIDGQIILFGTHSDDDGDSYHAIRFSPGAANVTANLRRSPRLLTPVDGGNGTLQTRFTMSGEPDSAKIWFFANNGGIPTAMVVVSTEDNIDFPSASEVGIDFTGSVDIDWTLIEVSPRLSTDEMAGPEGLIGATFDGAGFPSTPHNLVLPAP